jgi:predicted alpha/beta-fold hydrolase
MTRARLDFPRFVPRAPWLGPDLQTIRNVLRRPPDAVEDAAARTRIVLPLDDGTGDRLVAYLVDPRRPRDGAPLVILVHGLGGSSESTYIQVTTSHLLGLGYPVLQLNLRGAGESRPLCREQYHAGRTSDFREALAGLPPERVREGLVAVGFSLGGNMLLKHAAESGGLRGAVSISAPIDLRAASHRFLDARNRFYHRYLLAGMKRECLDAPAGISEEERALIPKLRTILEFDEQIVAPRNGYVSAEDYYQQNHARQFLGEIEIPTLVIHALDDPWIPSRSYTEYPWARNPFLDALLPSSGGHVGFHARDSRVPWHDRCLAVFLSNLGSHPGPR